MTILKKEPDLEGAYDLFCKQNKLSEEIIETITAMSLDNQKMMLELMGVVLVGIQTVYLTKDDNFVYLDLCRDARQLSIRHIDLAKEYTHLKDQNESIMPLVRNIFQLSQEINQTYFARLFPLKHKAGISK